MEKVVIVGAGPAGLLLAHALQQRGRYAIELYERRPDPREAPPSQERTFPISLQIRGFDLTSKKWTFPKSRYRRRMFR
jgi:kynurenine 3-monooxygenase